MTTKEIAELCEDMDQQWTPGIELSPESRRRLEKLIALWKTPGYSRDPYSPELFAHALECVMDGYFSPKDSEPSW